MEHKTHRIKEVETGSISEEMGVEPGDLLLSINGCSINDVIEYRYMINEEYLEILVQKPWGEEWLFEIDKEINEDLGMFFEEDMMDKARGCKNKCIFCFIDQLPRGLRKTLYFKDDDARLSFLHGNFITLTNLEDDDIERIIKYRISPLNVSVHATDPALRVKMLRNPKAARIMELLTRFVRCRISINTQIVMCPGINDKEHLDRTIKDLAGLWPGVKSIGIVPVGITRFREGLYPITPCDRESAQNVIEHIEGWQEKFLDDKGSRLVYASDEFYLKAGRPIPEADEYEGFLQLENGIGLISLFKQQFNKEFIKYKGDNKLNKSVSVVTGMAVRHFMKELSNMITGKFPAVQVKIYPVKNNFFGPTVDVTGLVTGGDIINQLKNKDLGNELIIPESMLKSGERIFLDDVTVENVASALDVKVNICPVNGSKFLRKIVEEEGVCQNL